MAEVDLHGSCSMDVQSCLFPMTVANLASVGMARLPAAGHQKRALTRLAHRVAALPHEALLDSLQCVSDSNPR